MIIKVEDLNIEERCEYDSINKWIPWISMYSECSWGNFFNGEDF